MRFTWIIRSAAAILAMCIGASITHAQAPERDWRLADGSVVHASYVSFLDGQVTVQNAEGGQVTWPLENLSPEDQQQVLRLDDTPLPRQAPPWLPGYRVRYALRLVGKTNDAADDLVGPRSQTVIAQIPTGGWMRDDARDLVMTTATGKTLPTAVLAHDPRGDTIVQFTRNGYDRWYWVYAVNPEATGPDPQLLRRIDDAKRTAEESWLRKMAATKASSQRGEEYRNIFTAIDDQHKALINVEQELSAWEALLPDRIDESEAAGKEIQALREALSQVEQALAPLKQAVDEKSAAAEALEPGTEARRQADDAARVARLAAAPATAAVAAVHQKLTELTPHATAAEQARTQGQTRVQELNTRKTQIEEVLADLEPRLASARQTSITARVDARQAVQDAKISEEAYFSLAVQTDLRLWKEGLTAEYRHWTGENLSTWAAVVEGLQQSDNVMGCTVLPQVHQYLNPFRREDPRRYAASYRGYLNIQQPGVYRFFVNSNDTVFLFIDGYCVFSRTGYNRLIDGNILPFSIGADIELEAGVHPFEVHQVVGNALNPHGMCTIRWMIPGSHQWQYLPPETYTQALTAVPVNIEAWDGKPVAVFDFGVDDTLAADGVKLYLTRFEAQGSGGAVLDPNQLTWDFGDGTSATGAAPAHIYFNQREYEVALRSHPELPPFRRHCYPWQPPVLTSPLALPKAVSVLSSMQIEQLNAAALNDVFHFLSICAQPERWPLLERVCRHLLIQQGLDLQYRAQLYAALMNALAYQGKDDQAVALIQTALDEVSSVRTLRVAILLQAANMNRDVLGDLPEADRLYAQIIDESERLRHPLVREAAVSWGDMYVEAGRLAAAGQAYRLAQSLGAIGPVAEAQGDPTKRGALLRVAEQQLRGGDIHQMRRLLRQIEQEFPEQRIEALYRFLYAESERYAGRYNSALRNYEMVPQLPQGDGYRDQALFGMADTYQRMGQYDQALELLEGLSQSFPDFYAKRRIAPYQAQVKQRAEALLAAPSDTTAFAGIETGFETEKPTPNDLLAGARLLPSLGIDGSHTVFIETSTGRQVRLPVQWMRSLPPQGSLWVEFWYRERKTAAMGDGNLRLSVEVRDAQGQTVSNDEVWPYHTYGQWHKAGFALAAPATLDGSAAISVRGYGTLLEIDGLKILPVSDAQNDVFEQFIEGADPQ